MLMKDFRQKRRDRAIPITDIAIKKVKRIRLFGFSLEQEEAIQRIHKQVLLEAKRLNEDRKSTKFEVGIMIDLHTWRYFIIQGKEECSVEMKDNPEAYEYYLKAKKNQLMFIHNHPSTGTFSGEDFEFFCSKEVFYIATIVGNDGTIYMLRKGASFDNRILGEYDKLANKYYNMGNRNNNGTLAMKDILKIASQFDLEYRKG